MESRAWNLKLTEIYINSKLIKLPRGIFSFEVSIHSLNQSDSHGNYFLALFHWLITHDIHLENRLHMLHIKNDHIAWPAKTDNYT